MRNLLGRIRLEPVTPDIGRPYLRAAAKLQVIELMAKEATPPDWEAGSDSEPDGGSNSLQWWTRSQRIRTFGEVPFDVALLEAGERPAYQRIAEEAERLRRLGMNNARISRHLKVDPKTVEKALKWRHRKEI